MKKNTLQPDIKKEVFTWEWLVKLPYGKSGITCGPASSARQKAWAGNFKVKVEELGNGRRKITKLRK